VSVLRFDPFGDPFRQMARRTTVRAGADGSWLDRALQVLQILTQPIGAG
jgi:hypothetical protein